MKRKKAKEKEEKKERLKKKEKLERQWEMLRWITSFIDEHKSKWDETDKEREEKRKEWDKKSKDEKIIELKQVERKEKNREEKLELARTKKEFWTEWRGGKSHPEPKPQPRTDEIDPSTPSKRSAGGGGRGERMGGGQGCA